MSDEILGIVRRWVPLVHDAFQDYVLAAASLSGPAVALLRAALASDAELDPGAFGVSGRELRELVDALPELAGRLRRA